MAPANAPGVGVRVVVEALPVLNDKLSKWMVCVGVLSSVKASAVAGADTLPSASVMRALSDLLPSAPRSAASTVKST